MRTAETFVGIDVGGSALKVGLVDGSGRLLAADRRPLESSSDAQTLAEQAAQMTVSLASEKGLSPKDLTSVGIGIPGAVENGKILYTCNLPLKNEPFAQLFQRYLPLPVLLDNDANCAALGEWLFGTGRKADSFIMLTLGTGIGAGFVLGGTLCRNPTVGEAGHMVIERGGLPCSCGRRGCWELYASATGLVRMAKQAIDAAPDSLLSTIAAVTEKVDGFTVFQAAERGDPTARSVCRNYVEYLALGVTNLVNLFAPDVLAIGGGISRAPEELLVEPLRNIVERDCYGRHVGKLPQIVRSKLGNDAGMIGAAMLGQIL